MYKTLLVLAVLFNTIPRWVHGIYLWEHRSLYYVGQALSFVLVLLADKVKDVEDSEWSKRIYRIVIALAISNLLDELLFDPVRFGLNELAFAVFIIIMEVFIIKKKHEQY